MDCWREWSLWNFGSNTCVNSVISVATVDLGEKKYMSIRKLWEYNQGILNFTGIE